MKIFTTQFCNELLQIGSGEQLRERYGLQSYNLGQAKYVQGDFPVQLPEDLILDPSPDQDITNSIKLFSAMMDVERVQATDKRLWVTLSHTRFYEYSQKRWINEADSNRKIIERFHFEGNSIAARMRNSLSRLWWAARLTYDSSNPDPFYLTKLLWSKQDLYQNVVERSYGTYQPILHGFLEYYSNNMDMSREALRKLYTTLNAVGGVKSLATHSKEEVRHLLEEINTYYQAS